MFSLSDIIIPLCACFILVGIHAYLGVHVLARKVIFVDLALAQIAALGAVYALFLGLSFDADPLTIKLISVLFSFLGELIISLSKIKYKLTVKTKKKKTVKITPKVIYIPAAGCPPNHPNKIKQITNLIIIRRNKTL